MTIYSLDVLLSQFWTSPLFYVQLCFFLTCIQVSQEVGKVVWYSHLFKNFPQFVVIHTVKTLSLVNEAEVDIFLEFSCFFYEPVDFGDLISVFSAFSKSSLNIWEFSFYLDWATSILHEFEQTLGDGEGQGSLLSCSPWGHKESDMTNFLSQF